jgi:hypothetical protein
MPFGAKPRRDKSRLYERNVKISTQHGANLAFASFRFSKLKITVSCYKLEDSKFDNF